MPHDYDEVLKGLCTVCASLMWNLLKYVLNKWHTCRTSRFMLCTQYMQHSYVHVA